ncbi:5'-nucleotidase C-terminal domain-containing protein [Fervidobacterium thailandense]|uniref:LysM domain-containing protein n=1 Tax=Fervidobacterium thailandense TaxID=1008305 RepID=A0A1E3G3L4_9BACT|nr:5'-nucleotidase C-terminal domain-containing protein [Fervidobacterium thailandense]ODN30278.1 hypothetical protein A4H02_06210 [Fervidobacterium thailandense]
MKIRSLRITDALTIFLTLLVLVFPTFVFSSSSLQSKLVIVHTANLYGDLIPTNYFTGSFERKGAPYFASYLRNVREKFDSVLTIDTGNFLYGSAFGDYYLNLADNPVVKVFNLLGYDFFVPGTFELGLSKNQLEELVTGLKAKTIAANLNGVKGVTAYSIKTMKNGVRVAVVGIAVEYGTHSFTPYLAAAKKIIEDIRKNRKADVIVLATSSGIRISPATSATRSSESKFAFGDELIKTFSDSVDVFLFGNQTLRLAFGEKNKVYSLPPSNGRGVNQIEIVLSHDGKKWEISNAQVKTVYFENTEPDEVMLEVLKNYESALEKWLDEPVGSVSFNVPFHKYMALIEDNAAIEFVARNLMIATRSDFAIWNVFNPSFSGLPAGSLTRRSVYQLIGLTTTVKVLKIKGAELEKLLSQTLKYMKYVDGILVFSKDVLNSPWKVDLVEGLQYDLIVNKGKIRNISIKGKKLDPDREYTIVVPTFRTLGTDRINIGRVVMEIERPVSSILFETLLLHGSGLSFTRDFNRRTLVEFEYTVQPGDTLKQLEGRFGVSMSELIRDNTIIKNPNLLRPGWKIIYYRNYLELVPPLANFFVFED